MEDNGGNDQNSLPRPSWGKCDALFGMPGIVGLCRFETGKVPVWAGKADVRKLSCSLLPKGAPRTSQDGDVLRRAAHGAGAPCHELAPLAGWFQKSTAVVSPKIIIVCLLNTIKKTTRKIPHSPAWKESTASKIVWSPSQHAADAAACR